MDCAFIFFFVVFLVFRRAFGIGLVFRVNFLDERMNEFLSEFLVFWGVDLFRVFG